MTFFESLKKWFYTKNSSAASSDARVPLLDASGNPKGSDTMANLASVLGGIYPVRFGSNANPDDYDTNSYGYIEIDAQYSPTETYRGWYMFVLGNDNNFVQQYIVPDNASDSMCYIYYRKRYNNTWSDWHKIDTDIPSFYKDYANLGALASALGVAMIGENESINIDTITGLRFLNTTNMGTYWTPSASLPGSSDRRNTYALLISVKIPNSISGFQVAIHYDEKKMYFRTMASGNWTTWIAV